LLVLFIFSNISNNIMRYSFLQYVDHENEVRAFL